MHEKIIYFFWRLNEYSYDPSYGSILKTKKPYLKSLFMKTRNLYRFLIATTLCGLLFTACKKSSSSSSSTPSNSDLQTESDDQARVNSETEASYNDVSAAMTSQAVVTGSSEDRTVRYGVAVDGGNQDTVQGSRISNAVVTIDTVDNPHTITITYNGKTADSLRSRTGSIVISWIAGTRWVTQGDSVTVQFNNVAITRLSDMKTITFNGTHVYKNVSGGSLLSLTSNSATPITHTITSSNMSITFDNGTQRTWSVARKRVFSFNNGLVISETGTYTNGTLQNISEWGTTRLGNSFTAQITEPLVIMSSCGLQLTSGTHVLTLVGGTLTLTYGLNVSGQATGCPIAGSTYYFQLVWAGAGGKTYTFILPY
jgi:hypothetical protein